MTRRQLLSGLAAPRRSAARPNIILIMADDLGFSDLGCYGSEIPTPNLDRLARKGVRFTQFYNAARCCPTRASLLTGLYPHQAGMGHMGRDMGMPAYQGYLNRDCVTIAEALRSAGYATYLSGKWHVGNDRGQWPCDRGFDQSFATLGGTSDYFKPRNLVRNDQPATAEGKDYYLTDAFTEEAVAMLRAHRGKPEPYFLYLAYTAPHFPLQARAAEVARHSGRYRAGWDFIRRERHSRMIGLGLVDRRWPLSPRPPEAPDWESAAAQDDWDLRMATYAATVERLDVGVGRVLREADEENTIVVFLSDNGGCAETKPDASTYELPWANVSNTPFRNYKHWTHEGGISTPLIVSGPGVGRGRLMREQGHVIDILPTFLDLAGVRYAPGKRALEGHSFVPLLRQGKRPPERTLFWEHEGNRAVRQGPWKLVAGFQRDWELYHIDSDRTEQRNLAAQKPEIAARLKTAYAEWEKRCGVVPWRPDWEKRFGIPL